MELKGKHSQDLKIIFILYLKHRKNRFELREVGDVLLQQFRVSPVLC